MKTRQAADTDVGRVRDHNEDGYLVSPPLFAVADGMGGHEAGDVASSVALETLDGSHPGAHEAVPDWLSHMVEAANAAVYQAGSDRHAELLRPGTTLTSAYVTDDAVYIGHVGDSRAYLFRNGALSQVTNDHSLVAEWVREGRISEDEAKSHPKRSVITRALGIEPRVAIDIYKLVPLASDRLLLCSDGLSGFVDDATIAATLAEIDDPSAAVQKLIDLANEGGGEDNITCVIVDFLDSAEAGGDDKTQPLSVVDGAPAALIATTEADARTDETQTGSASGAGGGDATQQTADAAAAADVATLVDEPAVPEASAGGSDDTGDVDIVVHEPGGEPEPPKEALRKERRLGFWPKFAIWAGVFVVLVVGGWLTFNWVTSNSYYVGEQTGNVAIFTGTPEPMLGINTSELYQRTNLTVSQLPEVQQQNLAEGIEVDSLDDAEQTVRNLREIARETRAAETTTTTAPPPPPDTAPPAGGPNP